MEGRVKLFGMIVDDNSWLAHKRSKNSILPARAATG
jgi:hypothetical protein